MRVLLCVRNHTSLFNVFTLKCISHSIYVTGIKFYLMFLHYLLYLGCIDQALF